MMFRLRTFVVFSTLCCLQASATVVAGEPYEREIANARKSFELLQKGRFDAFVEASNDQIRTLLPAEKLDQVWRQITGAYGAYQREFAADAGKLGPHIVVVLHCAFERANLDVTVSFDADGKIAGLFFKPAQKDIPYAPPNYADPTRFREEEVTIAADPKFPLDGTLTLPKKSDGPVPAVILVHGSGPHDRDETILGNKPFKDIAWGLGSRDIAVLRYEKRTLKYGSMMDPFTITIDEETTDDAIAAARLLMGRRDIRGDAVFVLGHSLGATAAPQIGKREPKIAGLILLAAAARPLYELVDDQVPYLAQIDGRVDEAERKQIEKVRADVDKLRNGTWTKDDALLGAPAVYWAGLDKMKPIENAKSYDHPMLIVQGGRDYQVTDLDFDIWRSALDARKHVTLKRFAGLDHLMRRGKGPSSPEQYKVPGQVDAAVIRALAEWIHAQVNDEQ